jgi:release factor glutamine methyltransferase
MSDDLHGQVQVIVSNPPYIANDDREVHESVLEWEPHAALFAGNDGLDDVRVIINGAREWLCPSGWLVLEIGYQQGEAVSALMRQAGFVDVSVGDDLSGRQRFVEGRNPSA